MCGYGHYEARSQECFPLHCVPGEERVLPKWDIFFFFAVRNARRFCQKFFRTKPKYNLILLQGDFPEPVVTVGLPDNTKPNDYTVYQEISLTKPTQLCI